MMKFKLQNGVLDQVVEPNTELIQSKGEIAEDYFYDFLIKFSKIIIEAALIYFGIDWFVHLFHWVSLLGLPIGGIQL